jgi:hypothetical protein
MEKIQKGIDTVLFVLEIVQKGTDSVLLGIEVIQEDIEIFLNKKSIRLFRRMLLCVSAYKI